MCTFGLLQREMLPQDSMAEASYQIEKSEINL